MIFIDRGNDRFSICTRECKVIENYGECLNLNKILYTKIHITKRDGINVFKTGGRPSEGLVGTSLLV